ncbi:lysophospholipid acyltransferase LPCAT4 [Eucyclogobius newberryi]|uniref:lysophospholipid acyltransferase LPCAT4 n=1 Tax=Eucyclogobius newberryi TaxID=166745 RepID=UPI003B5B1E91
MDPLHPFFYRVKLTKAQRIKGVILGSVLFPLRMFLSALCFLVMWPVARLRLAGLSEEERTRPVRGWRQWLLHPVMWTLSRAAFLCLGFFWVRVKGRRASTREAPVLVAAPHSGFLDMLSLLPTQLPTVVSRSENTSLPVVGALLEYNQSVLVSRKDPQSRKKAVVQLGERLKSNGVWPQMLMFPEGTTTNGKVLIKFKPGAFLAGVPVQPVLLRYPNNVDTVRWTFKGTSWLECLWHTTSQLFTNMTVEFLPVYSPSDEEKNDPGLYADNVQKLMAKALGVPATDYILEGRVPVSKLGGLSLPVQSPPRETLALLHKNGWTSSDIEAALGRMIDRCQSQGQGSKVHVDDFMPLLGLKDRETARAICELYSKDESVDLRQVYLSVAGVSGAVPFRTLLHAAFALFDGGKGSVSAEELSGLMGALLGVPQHNTSELYGAACRQDAVTEDDLLRALTVHPAYQRVTNEYLQPQEAGSRPPVTALTYGSAVNNNESLANGAASVKKLD